MNFIFFSETTLPMVPIWPWKNRSLFCVPVLSPSLILHYSNSDILQKSMWGNFWPLFLSFFIFSKPKIFGLMNKIDMRGSHSAWTATPKLENRNNYDPRKSNIQFFDHFPNFWKNLKFFLRISKKIS